MIAILNWAFADLIFLSAGNASAQINPKKFLQKKAIEIINKKGQPPVKTSDDKDKPEVKDENVNAANKPEADKRSNNQVALQTYSKFNFVPGDKVVFFDDFSKGNIGDFH